MNLPQFVGRCAAIVYTRGQHLILYLHSRNVLQTALQFPRQFAERPDPFARVRLDEIYPRAADLQTMIPGVDQIRHSYASLQVLQRTPTDDGQRYFLDSGQTCERPQSLRRDESHGWVRAPPRPGAVQIHDRKQL